MATTINDLPEVILSAIITLVSANTDPLPARAYDAAARILRGPKAKTNFQIPWYTPSSLPSKLHRRASLRLPEPPEA
ncbi:hypothetical protein ACFX2I_005660 [Malus domestica]